MYDNVKSLRLVPEGNHTFVTAMISSEGEVLEFRHHRKYTTLHRVASHHAPLPPLPPAPPSPQPLLNPYALIANFKMELFYGSLDSLSGCPGQFLLINLKPVGVAVIPCWR